jgi:DNA invertase Pin-like site-specific DNA recombinase
MAKTAQKPTFQENQLFVAYYRTSTKDQVNGLDAQKYSIRKYVESVNGILTGEFQEHETGTSSRKRIQVYKAVATAIQSQATLIVHKIDRISRDMNFWSEVKRSNVKFLSLDNLSRSDLLADIMMSIGAHEHAWVKKRQRDAYDVLRRKGVKLGKVDNLTKSARAKAIKNSIATRRSISEFQNKTIVGHICDYRKAGWTYQKLADRLNELGHRTNKGNMFFPNTVKQLHDKFC